LQAMGMGNWDTPSFEPPIDIRTTRWVRARRAGLMQLETELGAKVDKGDVLGLISDALGNRSTRVTAPSPGHVIALNQNPLITQGEALVHIAS
ncbi:MAG: succinylglutamate desuccinylase/aspartoacylase family protein, partial [Acidimicrobiia bacterium]